MSIKHVIIGSTNYNYKDMEVLVILIVVLIVIVNAMVRII